MTRPASALRHGVQVDNASGIRNPDGTFFRSVTRFPTSRSHNEAGGALPLNRHVASPRLKQPYTDQISLGWSHQLDSSTVLDVDYVHIKGSASAGGLG